MTLENISQALWGYSYTANSETTKYLTSVRDDTIGNYFKNFRTLKGLALLHSDLSIERAAGVLREVYNNYLIFNTKAFKVTAERDSVKFTFFQQLSDAEIEILTNGNIIYRLFDTEFNELIIEEVKNVSTLCKLLV